MEFQKQLFYFLGLGLSISSCSTSYTLTNSFDANKIKKVSYVDPFCSILGFNDSTQKYYSDTNTVFVSQNVENLLAENRRAYHLSEKIQIKDSTLMLNFYADALSLASSIDKEYKLKNKSITLNISQVLNDQKEDYLSLIIYNRYIPSKRQKQQKVDKIIVTAAMATALGVVGGGAVSLLYPEPVNPLRQGGFYLLIFDKSSQKTCYYKKVIFSQNDYKNKKILKNKLDMLFKMFIVPQ
ncbi:MAG: hypothetical protein K0S44_2226 [Bacteroidetes bacterium]|jgi:hypothetical protein|nr:hypothetical protein [Bacteroidota bacterium]